MRVAVTGIGAVSALGVDAATTWAGLAAGRCGIRAISRFDAGSFAVRQAAEVADGMPALPPAVAATAARDGRPRPQDRIRLAGLP